MVGRGGGWVPMGGGMVWACKPKPERRILLLGLQSTRTKVSTFITKYKQLEDVQQNLEVLAESSPTMKVQYQDFEVKFDTMTKNKKDLQKCIVSANIMLKNKDSLGPLLRLSSPPLSYIPLSACRLMGDNQLAS